MRRRFVAWAWLLVALLGGSSAVGLLARSAFDLSDPDETPSWRPAPPPARPNVTRTDLLTRGPTKFGPPAPPPAGDTDFVAAVHGAAAEAAQGNPWGFDQRFDAHRASEEWGPLGAFTLLREEPTTDRLAREEQGWQKAVRQFAAADPRFAHARDTRVVSVARATVGSEARVVARHTGVIDGVPQVWFTRYWLSTKSSAYGQWAVYDFDEPGSRLRFTVRRALDASARQRATPGGPLPGGGEAAIEGGYAAAVRDGLAAAARGEQLVLRGMAAKLRSAELIPAGAAARMVLEGYVLLADGKPAEALARFDEARKAWDDTPTAALGRAAALNRLGRSDDALAAVRDYRSLVGNDPGAYREEAVALAGKGDAAKAAAAARAGLEETPGDLPLLVELFRVLPPDARAEAGERAANGLAPGALLAKLTDAMDGGDAPAEQLAAVVSGFRQVRPRDAGGLIEDAILRVRRGRPDVAGPLLKDGLDRLPDPKGRANAVARFARKAVAAGAATDAYAAAAATVYAKPVFRDLAAGLVSLLAVRGDGDGPAAALRALTAAHATKHPDDPWADYYAAEGHLLANDLAAADRALAAGIGKLPKPAARADRAQAVTDPTAPGYDPAAATWELFRGKRAAVLFRLGKWRQAYAELPPAADTFDQLADLMARADDADGLLALAAEHRKAAPGDPAGLLVQAEGHWRKKEYEPAVRLAGEYLAAADADAPGRRAAGELRVRGLVRLGRPTEARQAAADLPPGGEESAALLGAVVAAAEGDAGGVASHLAALAARGWRPARFYADPDLGPRLRDPALAALRQTYPPPRE